MKAAKWLESIDEILNKEEPISLDVIRSCVDQGIGLRKKQGIHNFYQYRKKKIVAQTCIKSHFYCITVNNDYCQTQTFLSFSV